MLQEKCRVMGARVKYYRTVSRLNQSELAKQVGVSYQHLSRIETGKQAPSFLVLVSIAKALKVDLAELVRDAI